MDNRNITFQVVDRILLPKHFIIESMYIFHEQTLISNSTPHMKSLFPFIRAFEKGRMHALSVHLISDFIIGAR